MIRVNSGLCTAIWETYITVWATTGERWSTTDRLVTSVDVCELFSVVETVGSAKLYLQNNIISIMTIPLKYKHTRSGSRTTFRNPLQGAQIDLSS